MDEQEQTRVILAVELLFEKMREGRLHFVADAVPKTIRQLGDVQFDEQGKPIYDTVGPLVRGLALAVLAGEIQAVERELEEYSPVNDVLPPAVEVSDEVLGNETEPRLSELAFELYKEACGVLGVVAGVNYRHEDGQVTFPRNQAICVGLIVRMAKFMRGIVQLTSLDGAAEVVLALNRCILESAVSICFLISRNDPRLYDKFVAAGLAPEREFYDQIQRNIAERDAGELPIETRMLKSIRTTCAGSNVRIEDVNKSHKHWGGSFRNMLEAIDWGEAYAAFYRLPSHVVHGTWVDLVLHHLESEDNDTFSPEFRSPSVDERLLGPVAQIVLRAAGSYLNAFLGDTPEVRPLRTRITDLNRRIRKVADAYEVWLQGQQ